MDTDSYLLEEFACGLRAVVSADSLPLSFWDITVVFTTSRGEENVVSFGHVYFDYESVLRAVAAAKVTHPGFSVIRLRRWMLSADGDVEMELSMEITE